LDEIWYTLNDGLNNYPGATRGTLDVTAWNNAGQGAVTITFYVNDSAGNWDSANVGVNKDSVDPSIDSIDSPLPGMWFSTPSPSYSLSITETNLDEIWYTLDGGTNNFTGTTSGTIDVTAWSNAGQGAVTITFYVNDSAGNWDAANVVINKDSIDPSINNIDSPSSGAWFSTPPPSYSLSITETNMDEIWYTLDGGTNNYTGVASGTIDSTAWSNAGEGVVTIVFYVNDSAGNWETTRVIVNKDSVNPSLDSIDLPIPGSYHSTPPSYSLSITETNLDEIRYTLDGGTNNYTGVMSGTIDSTAWSSASQGVVTITFYVNDSAGNWDSLSVGINKDSVDPSINSIDSPSSGSWFDSNPPSYSISITETNLDTIWYTLDGGLNNYTGATNGMIDSTAWSNAGQGAVTIMFYVNDSASNWDSSSVGVNKDTIAPILVLNTPINNTYVKDRPLINIIVYDYFATLTYTVLGYSPIGLTNNTDVYLNQVIWDDLSQGEFRIVITGFDFLGQSSNFTIILYKDTEAPSLTINSPVNNTYWNLRPYLNITAIDPNLDTIWYSVNNVNITLQNNTFQQLNISIWNALPDEGEFTVQIYANDTFGHLNHKYILTLYKDIVAPTLIINSPLNNTYHDLPPIINVTVIDPYFQSLWYRVGTQDIVLINNTNQQLDSNIWDSLPEEGGFTIYFYANDSVGNLNDLFRLDLNRDIRNPLVIINNPNPNDLFGDLAPDIDISINELNLNQTWYMLYNQTWNSLNYSFNELTGRINQTAWDEFWNGSVTIRFYANDTLNHLGFSEVSVRKNIFAPIITIVSPENNDLFGIEAPNITLHKSGLELNTTWYTLDYGATNYTFFGLNVVINQAAWGDYGFGDVIITFYINNSLGKIGFDVITLEKDPDPPELNITFINPISNNSHYYKEPTFRITAYDPNLVSIWYRVGLTNITIINNTIIVLNNTIWNGLSQGKFTIEVFAVDSLGYLNDSITLTFYKDTLAPILVINQPYDGYSYNTPPPINITVYDPNFAPLSFSYTVVGYTPDSLSLANNTISVLNDTIWDNLPQGEFLVSITAKDYFGHTASYILTLYKDTMPPVFNSIIPSNFTCYNSRPILKISYLDPNLQTIYYKIDTSKIFILNNTEQFLDSSIWNGLSEGIFTIEFYANDTFGYMSSLLNLILVKDTTVPLITINFPLNNTNYKSPPMMNIVAFDINLDDVWYSVKGTNVLLSGGPEHLSSSIWDSLDQGEFDVCIFANDSAGNLNDSIILTLYKDTVAPLVTINLPLNNTNWNSNPIFNVGAYDQNPVTIWYHVVGYFPISLSNNTDEPLINFIWSNLSDEIFFVDIFAEDSLGNLNDSIRLTLYKDTVQPVIDIILPQPNDIYGDIAPSFTISVTEDHLNTTWYIIIGESTIIQFTGFSGTIDQTTWDLFGNESVSIRFYANDTTGNIGYKDITVQKNIFDPIITITSPGNNDLFGITAPNFIIYKSGPLLQSTWYTLDNGITNITFTGLSGTINQTVWDYFGFDVITLRFYIIDSFGKIGFDEVSIRKDPDMPIIIVNAPDNYSASASSPFINLTITEPNLHKVWYCCNTLTVDITNDLSQYLDFLIWNNLPQGQFIISLFANDTLGNCNILCQLNLSKDTIGPNITIILPTQNQKVDRSAPYFELSIFDENGVDSCWYTIDLGETTIPFTGLIGRIDQNLWEQIWDNLAQGAIITIRFCAKDTLGNEDYTELILIVEKPIELPKFLSNPLGLISSVLGLVAIIPFTLKMTKTRYYKSISNKDKKNLRNILITAGFFLSLLTLYYIF